MENLNFNLLHPSDLNWKSKQQCLVNRLCYGCGHTQQDAGFSLLELIVVMVMIGILSAIAAPSWFSFVNRQQVNKANDAVLTALQEAQSEAKRNKLSYSVSFQKNTTTQNVEFAIYRTNPGVPTWKTLGSNVGGNSNQLLLGANLDGENTVNSTSTVSYPAGSTSTKITFDYMGTLSSPTPNFGTDTGLKIVVAVPSSPNSASPSTIKRCVIVKTLLGSMGTAKDNQCN